MADIHWHLADGQVYALIAPSESTYPFIVYTPVSGEQILGINGLHGLERIRVQVDCCAKTYAEALGLQDEVLLAILAAKNTVSDVRMVLTDFESETRSYRVSVGLHLPPIGAQPQQRLGSIVGDTKIPSSAVPSQGITIARFGTTAFETIPNVVSFQGPGGQASVIDVTNLASTAKEKRVGLRDEGQLSLSLHFNPDDPVHIAMRADRAANTRRQYEITFTDSTPPATWTFYGYVTQFSVQGGVDAVVEASVTIEIDGSITEG